MSAAAPLVRNWTYRPSSPGPLVRLSRWKSLLTGRVAFPAHAALRRIGRQDRWNGLFLYLPDGRITPSQRFTVERLIGLSGASAVVCATPHPDHVPVAQLTGVDALYWKGLGGFDFSAYALLAHEVAQHSPGATLYLQNDSVLGPFGDVDALVATMPWRVGGFLASSAMENHLQSYALVLRNVDHGLLSRLAPALSTRRAYDHWRDVVNLQETRLARLAGRSESVGALWYAPHAHEGAPRLWEAAVAKFGRSSEAQRPTSDPSLRDAPELLGQGFPFLKRSLFTRNAHLQPRAPLDAFLAAQGHPPLDPL